MSRRKPVVAGVVTACIIFAMSLVSLATCTTGWYDPSDNDCHGGWYIGCGWKDAAGGETAYDGDWAWTDVNGREHEYDSFGIGLSPTAVIVGFDVRIRGYTVGGGGIQIALSHDGGSTLDFPAGPTPWSVSLPAGAGNAAWRSVSISNPPFIHEFTPADVMSNNFTVWVKANVFGTAVYVDAVEVRVVYYDEAILPNTPLNPTVSTTTAHAPNVWYGPDNPNPGSIDFEWPDATDRPSCASGIAGYQFYWDTSGTTSLGSSTGWWLGDVNECDGMAFGGTTERWAHLRAKDKVGNWADTTLHYGPFLSDETEPVDPSVTTSHDGVLGSYTNVSPVDVTLTGASDAHSGLDGYGIVWDHSLIWTSTSTKTHEAEAWANPTVFTLADGRWYLHLATRDNVGNWTETPWPGETVTVGPIQIDTTTPNDPTLGCSSHTVGALSSNPDIIINVVAAAEDPLAGEAGYQVASGIDGYEIAFNQSATWTPSRSKTDEETWSGETFHATSEGSWYVHLATKDVAGNWTSTVHLGPFDIDLTAPRVTTVTADDALITDADNGGTFAVTVTFDESMDPAYVPTIVFSPAVASTLTLRAVDSGWDTSATYIAKYTVSDAGVDHDSVTIDVTGARDAAGNLQQDYTPEHEFAIDTVNPIIAASSLSDLSITYADLGTVFTVTVRYSESMHPVHTPTVAFSQDVEGGGKTLETPLAGWSSTVHGNDTYTASYTIGDQDLETTGVTVTVSGGRDAKGNPFEGTHTVPTTFDIDTLEPSVVVVTADDTLLTDIDAGNILSIVVDFNATMDTRVGFEPSISFDPAVGSSLSFVAGDWTDGDTFVATYTVSDAEVDIAPVLVDVTGATDAAGNPQLDYTAVAEFEIDTLNPTLPGGLLPLDGSFTADTTPTVSWAASSDPGGGIAFYEWETTYVGISVDTGATTGLSVTGAAYASSYVLEWRVRAQDLVGNRSDWTAVQTLYVDGVAPVIAGCPSDIALDNDPGFPGAFVYWTDPTADDAVSAPFSGMASFTSSHASGAFFPVGVTTVTYTAVDQVGNSSVCRFDITVDATCGVEPCAAAGFLDHGWGEDEEIPIVGELPVLAVYEVGELVRGCCMLRDPNGELMADEIIIFTVYTAYIGEGFFDERIPLDARVLQCAREQDTYCFAVETDKLEPGYLDIRLGFPDESVMWLRVELVAPAP